MSSPVDVSALVSSDIWSSVTCFYFKIRPSLKFSPWRLSSLYLAETWYLIPCVFFFLKRPSFIIFIGCIILTNMVLPTMLKGGEADVWEATVASEFALVLYYAKTLRRSDSYWIYVTFNRVINVLFRPVHLFKLESLNGEVINRRLNLLIWVKH